MALAPHTSKFDKLTTHGEMLPGTQSLRPLIFDGINQYPLMTDINQPNKQRSPAVWIGQVRGLPSSLTQQSASCQQHLFPKHLFTRRGTRTPFHREGMNTDTILSRRGEHEHHFIEKG
jgi:hypothetical protein